MHFFVTILVFVLMAVGLPAVEVFDVKELDNMQVRDFRTSGVAQLGSHGSSSELVWRIYGETAQLRGKEYQLGGFRMELESAEQGQYVISTPAANFEVSQVQVHGDGPVSISGPGMQIGGVGFDLFTDASEGLEGVRQVIFVIREAVEMEVERSALRRLGHGEALVAPDGDSARVTLNGKRLTMQLTPQNRESSGAEKLPEGGVVTLEGDVRLRIPPESPSKPSGHQFDEWELSGDRMLVFLAAPVPGDGVRHSNWVERVEVNGHLRVETDGGQQRLMGERGVFTSVDERLTIDGNVLMMSQFRGLQSGGEQVAPPRWNLFFTNRATLYFASGEERKARREAGQRESVVSRVELPGVVTMIAEDGSYRLRASRGEYSGSGGCVSLLEGVEGELQNPSLPGGGDYLLEGEQVDFLLVSEDGGAGAGIVFPAGLSLRQRSGGSQVQAGWASLTVQDREAREVQVVCRENVWAQLHGQDGQGYELSLTGSQMVMNLQFTHSGVDSIAWIDLPSRVTVWGRVKGISHRVGGDSGRYARDMKTIELQGNVALTLEPPAKSGTASEGSAKEAQDGYVFANRAVVSLGSEPGSHTLGIERIDLMEEVRARTGDFSIYLTANEAHYDYLEELLELAGSVRAEVTPGNGERDLRQAVTLDTERVRADAGLQRVFFPESLVLSSQDQTVRLTGREGVLDILGRNCALGGGTRVAFASRRRDSRAATEVGLATERLFVQLGERNEKLTGTGKSQLAIERIELPSPLELYTADGRQRLKGDRGSYSAKTNAVELSGGVEARFAGENFEEFNANTFGSIQRRSEDLVLNCELVSAHLRNEALSQEENASETERALSMLESLEIPGKVTVRSEDGSRFVSGDRCRYEQSTNAITLDGDCRVEYTDERGTHRLESPQVVFDGNTRTITTGVEATQVVDNQVDTINAEAPAPHSRTTITIPFANRATETREPAGLPRGLNFNPQSNGI